MKPNGLLLCLTVTLAGLLTGWVWPTPTRLSFLQVGQGDCTVWQSGGQTLVVDAGPELPGIDLANRTTVPELRRLLVEQIDVLVLTHPDIDHIGGLNEVTERFPVRTVLVSAAFQDDPAMLAALTAAKVPSSRIVWVEGSAKFTIGSSQVTVYAPPVTSGDNSASLCTLVAEGRSRAVLTGDAPMPTEAWLLAQNVGAVDIVNAGHHGSGSSTGSAWLAATSPKFVVASCGRSNGYGHPDAAVITRARQQGSTFLRTDADGTLTFVPSASGFALHR